MSRSVILTHSCPPSSSLDGREHSGAGQNPSSLLGPRRVGVFRRLNDSRIGDVIGGLALFAILIGGLWVAAALS